MADRVEWFTVTIPAGTLPSAPMTFPCVFPQGEVTEVDIKVPPGPSGTVGFYVAAGGSQYIPRTPGSFIVPDDIYLTWPLANAINSGSWSVVAYNTGNFPHTLQLAFQVDELNLGAVSSGYVPGASSAALAAVLPPVPIAPAAPLDPLSADALIASIPADLSA